MSQLTERLLRSILPEHDAEVREQAVADALEARRFLWLHHGHDQRYSDDGEMQCGQCKPWDYKRAPLSDLVKAAVEAIREQAKREHEAVEKDRRVALRIHLENEHAGLVAEAMWEQMEADCRAVCVFCREGKPVKVLAPERADCPNVLHLGLPTGTFRACFGDRIRAAWAKDHPLESHAPTEAEAADLGRPEGGNDGR